MYTTDHLIQECVGEFIEHNPYSINRSSLLSDRQYLEIWTCLLQWTEKQIKRKNSFIIPHFGLIQYNNNNENLHKDENGTHENQRWKFYIQSRFITEQNAKLAQNTNIDSITKNELNNSAAIKCCISSLSQYSSSLSESQLIVGLKHIFNKLFQQIGRSTLSTKNYSDIDSNFERHLKILINFGWGYLLAVDGIIDFIFTLNESLIINPNIPKGLKNIPKKFLQSTTSLISYSSIPSNVKITNSSERNNEINEFANITKQIENFHKTHKLLVGHDYNNPLIHLSSRNTITELSNDKSEYPPVLSPFSRTLVSTYCEHRNYETPSTKIGLFYTPTAALYRINTTSKVIEYTNYLPFFQANPQEYCARNVKNLSLYELKYKVNHAKYKNISCLETDIAKSCQRYYEYLHNGMNEICDDSLMSTLQNETIAKILSKLQPDLSLLSQSKVEQILQNNLEIIKCENISAIKQSILDYVLKNNRERIRLNILIPPHDLSEWGYSLLPFSAPLSWNNRLQKAWNSINNSSYFVNSSIIEMLCLWQNYNHYRLFCIPLKLDKDRINLKKTNGTKKKRFIEPMRIEEFDAEQAEHLEFVRNIFVNNWYNESVNIMKKYVEEQGLDSSDKSTITLFCAIAAFMRNKLCEIVYESLKDCVKYFEENENECLWKMRMNVCGRDGGIQYEISNEEINLAINEMIENIVTCFDDIPCVEGKIFALLEDVPPLTVFIDEEIKQQTIDKILNITSRFNQQLIDLKNSYCNKFMPLLSANNELTRKLLQIENDDSINDNLSQFKTEITKYEEIRRRVINKNELKYKVGLFCVECQSLNALIVNHAQDLKNAITNHVAKKLIDKAQKLVIHCEDYSKKLLRKPKNANEFIELIKYIKLFDESELSKLQNICDEIGKELQFLFDTEHPLTHDLLRNVARVNLQKRKIIQHKSIADQNAVTQKQVIQTMINEKSKEFEIKIKKLYQQVEGLNLLSEIKDHQEQINKVQENMKIISKEKQYIENEQHLLQMQISQFKLYKLLQDAAEKLSES